MARCTKYVGNRLTVLILLAILWQQREPAVAQVVIDSGEEQEELALELHYETFVRQYVSARYYKGNIYVPVQEIFRALELRAAPDEGARQLTGSHPSGAKFTINPGSRSVTVDQKKYLIPTDGLLVIENEYYILPELFHEWFGFDCTVTMQRLLASIVSSRALPVKERIQRQVQRESIRDPFLLIQQDTLLSGRKRKLLSFGFADYRLYHSSGLYGSTFTGDVDVSGQVLGGAFNWQAGNYGSAGFRWAYALDPNPFLQQVHLGRQWLTGPIDLTIDGVRLTNRPAQDRRYFSRYTYHGFNEPGWETEVLMNGRLIGLRGVDEPGEFAIDLPLTYGSTFYTVRKYGPGGERYDDPTAIDVPQEVLPAGAVEYDISGGRCVRDCESAGQAVLAAGLHNRLTAGVGLLYTDASVGQLKAPGLILRTRLGARSYAAVEAWFDAYYDARVDVQLRNGLTAGAGAHRESSRSQVITGGARTEYSASAAIPFGVLPIPLTTRGDFWYSDYGSHSIRTFRTHTDLRLGLLWLRYSFHSQEGASATTKHAYVQHEAGAGVTIPRRWWLIGSTRFMVTEILDRHRQQAFTRLDISRPVTSAGTLQFSMQTMPGLDGAQATVFLAYRLPWFRATASSNHTSGSNAYTQSVSGTIAVDPVSKRLVPYYDAHAGRSAAVVRMYVDENLNRKYDVNEAIVVPRQLQLDGASGQGYTSRKGIRFMNLNSYERYGIDLTGRVFDDPVLVPLHPAFSFQADPNTVKVIDIPLVVSGILEGEIRMEGAGKNRPLAGIRLRIEQLDGDFQTIVETFEDGSFYRVQLPPGRYRLSLVEEQLAQLGYTPNLTAQDFEVKALPGGDLVSGISFSLRPSVQGTN